MNNEPPNVPESDESGAIVPVEEEYPVDRIKARMNQSLGGRPLTVYLVLFAGAATLLALLAVVWISATGGNDDKNEQICTEISADDARTAVLTGAVEQIIILVDADKPVDSLTGVQLRFADGSCRQTPQGADIRDQLFSVIGAVSLYNNYADNTIQIKFQAQQIESELLATSTDTPGATDTPTIVVTEPASPAPPPPTVTETETPSDTATVAPTETVTPAPTETPAV